jgi:hypothetical protein
MALNNANNPVSVSVHLGTVSSSSVLPALYIGRRSALKAAWLQNGSAEAHSGTNYVQVQLQIAGMTPVTLASFDGSVASVTPGDGKGDLAADIASLMAAQQPPLTGTQGGLYTGGSFPNEYPVEIPAGSSLQTNVVIGGSGTLTNAKLIMEYWEL